MNLEDKKWMEEVKERLKEAGTHGPYSFAHYRIDLPRALAIIEAQEMKNQALIDELNKGCSVCGDLARRNQALLEEIEELKRER